MTWSAGLVVQGAIALWSVGVVTSCATTITQETTELLGPSQVSVADSGGPPLRFEWKQAAGRLVGKGQWSPDCVADESKTVVREKVTTRESYAPHAIAIGGGLLAIAGFAVYTQISTEGCQSFECEEDRKRDKMLAYNLGVGGALTALGGAAIGQTLDKDVKRETLSSQEVHEQRELPCGKPRDFEAMELVVQSDGFRGVRPRARVRADGTVDFELSPLDEPAHAIIAVAVPPLELGSLVPKGWVAGRLTLQPW